MIDFAQKLPNLRRRYRWRFVRGFLIPMLICLTSVSFSSVAFAQNDSDPVRFIPVYVEPYYVAGRTADEPPKVKVWSEIDALLASLNKERILEAKKKIEDDATRGSPLALMVLAIRLFDVGLRDDAVFWFYAAKERYLVMEKVLRIQSDPLAGIGDAMNSFNVLAGPFINGYAFCNPDMQIQQREDATAWNEQNTYVALFRENLPALSGSRKDNLQSALKARRESLNKEREYLAKPETLSELVKGRKASGADKKYCTAPYGNTDKSGPANALPITNETGRPNITYIDLEPARSSIHGLRQGTYTHELGANSMEADFNIRAVELGCPRGKYTVRPYILTDPITTENGDTWKERWYLPDCGSKHIDIEFRVTKARLFMFNFL